MKDANIGLEEKVDNVQKAMNDGIQVFSVGIVMLVLT